MIIIKRDKIISLNPKYSTEYIRIEEITQIGEFSYKANIIENTLSEEIKETIKEYWECVDLFNLSLLDDLEEKIKEYNFILKDSGISIFDIELKGNFLTFFSKYPTSEGFLDTYP